VPAPDRARVASTGELNSCGTWLDGWRCVAAFDLKTSVRKGRPPRCALRRFLRCFYAAFLFARGSPAGFFGRCLRVCVLRLYLMFHSDPRVLLAPRLLRFFLQIFS